MSGSSRTPHRGLRLSVLKHCLPRASQDLPRGSLIASRGCGLFHIIYAHPSITMRQWDTKPALQSKAKKALWLSLTVCLAAPPRRQTGQVLPPETLLRKKPSYLTTIVSEYLALLHRWRSSGNNLHSFHRCWPFKRNADFELHLSFQNIAFPLNSECVTLSTDGALLHSPRLCFYGTALHKEGRMAAFTERSGEFNPHLWHSLLSPQQWSLSRRPLANQKSLRSLSLIT